jgi:hypothetical protein
MRELLLQAGNWWLGTALGGGAILLAGCGLMRLARQPAARQRLGEWSVLAALVVAVLRLLPAWLPLPWSATAATAAVAATEPVQLAALPPALQPLDGVWVELPAEARGCNESRLFEWQCPPTRRRRRPRRVGAGNPGPRGW